MFVGQPFTLPEGVTIWRWPAFYTLRIPKVKVITDYHCFHYFGGGGGEGSNSKQMVTIWVKILYIKVSLKPLLASKECILHNIMTAFFRRLTKHQNSLNITWSLDAFHSQFTRLFGSWPSVASDFTSNRLLAREVSFVGKLKIRMLCIEHIYVHLVQ